MRLDPVELLLASVTPVRLTTKTKNAKRPGGKAAPAPSSLDCYPIQGTDPEHGWQKGTEGLRVGDASLLHGPQDAPQAVGEAPEGLAQEHGFCCLGGEAGTAFCGSSAG